MAKKKKTTIIYTVYYCTVIADEVRSRTKQAEYKTKEEAQEHVNKYNSRKKAKYTAILVPIPKNLQVGTKVLWRGNSGKEEWKDYGIITRFTEYFIYINRTWKDKDDEVFFIKESFSERIANEQFKIEVDED